MYSLTQNIKYSNMDMNNVFKVADLFDIFQDTSISHTRSLNFEEDSIYARYVWLLLEWQIEIKRLPYLYEDIEVVTLPYSNKGYFGRRSFYINSISQQEEFIVKADSTWMLYDTVEKRSARVDSKNFPYKLFPAIDMELEKEKFWVSSHHLPMEKLMEVDVDYSMIDTNFHVNNAAYVRTLSRVYTKMPYAKKIRVVYRKPLLMGDKFISHILKSEQSDIIFIKNQNNEECVFMKFTYDKDE